MALRPLLVDAVLPVEREYAMRLHAAQLCEQLPTLLTTRGVATRPEATAAVCTYVRRVVQLYGQPANARERQRLYALLTRTTGGGALGDFVAACLPTRALGALTYGEAADLARGAGARLAGELAAAAPLRCGVTGDALWRAAVRGDNGAAVRALLRHPRCVREIARGGGAAEGDGLVQLAMARGARRALRALGDVLGDGIGDATVVQLVSGPGESMQYYTRGMVERDGMAEREVLLRQVEAALELTLRVMTTFFFRVEGDGSEAVVREMVRRVRGAGLSADEAALLAAQGARSVHIVNVTRDGDGGNVVVYEVRDGDEA